MHAWSQKDACTAAIEQLKMNHLEKQPENAQMALTETNGINFCIDKISLSSFDATLKSQD